MLRLNVPDIQPDSPVIRGADYAAFVDADAIIADAQQKAEQIVQQAEAKFEERRQAGYEQGLTEGRAEMAEKMMDTIASSVDFLSGLETRVVGLVSKSLQKILGEMDRQERVTSVVRNALAVTRNESKVTVRVHPDDLDTVQQRMDDIMKPYPGIKYIDVVSDSRLDRDGCILETEVGVVDASLDVQLATIQTSLARTVNGESPA